MEKSEKEILNRFVKWVNEMELDRISETTTDVYLKERTKGGDKLIDERNLLKEMMAWNAIAHLEALSRILEDTVKPFEVRFKDILDYFIEDITEYLGLLSK